MGRKFPKAALVFAAFFSLLALPLAARSFSMYRSQARLVGTITVPGPDGPPAKVALSLTYLAYGSGEVLGHQQVEAMAGASLDLSDGVVLSKFGISAPDGHTFVALGEVSGCVAGDGLSLTLPGEGPCSAEVYCRDGPAFAMARLYDANTQKFLGTAEVPLDASGEVRLTVAAIRALHPAFASGSSFSVGVQNGASGYNVYEVGNPYVSGPVTLGYRDVYGGGYSLSYDGMYLFIGRWW